MEEVDAPKGVARLLAGQKGGGKASVFVCNKCAQLDLAAGSRPAGKTANWTTTLLQDVAPTCCISSRENHPQLGERYQCQDSTIET